MANKSKKSLDINGLEYVASKVMTLVNSGGTADYIVEEGTSGIWTYRKWASGVAECWGKTTASFDQSREFEYSYLSPLQAAIDYPFTFIEKQYCNIVVSKLNSYVIISGDDNPLTKTPTFYVACATKVTSTRTGEIYFKAKGLWKEFTPSIMNTPSLDLYYPIGSIYQTSNADFDPNVTFGGTWELITNKFLIGAGDEYENGAEGGEATHTLTIDEMPSHSHDTYGQVPRINDSTISGTKYGHPNNTTNWWFIDVASGTKSSGGGQAHNNLPPYKAVFMWERTA